MRRDNQTDQSILRGESVKGMLAAEMTGPARTQEAMCPGMPSVQPLLTLSKSG